MKLVSFQSMNAFKQLVNKGYLETDERFVDVKKMGPTYNWLIDKMNENIRTIKALTEAILRETEKIIVGKEKEIRLVIVDTDFHACGMAWVRTFPVSL